MKLRKKIRAIVYEIAMARVWQIRGIAIFFAIVTTLVCSAPAQAANPSTVPVKATDLSYSPFTGLLYASVPANAPKYANSLAAINVNTGTVVGTVAVGNNPSKLALSDDGRYLYVVYDSLSIKRYNLSTLQSDRSFRITLGAATEVTDMQVMPANPDTVAVFINGIRAIAILDKGIMRPTISTDTFGNILAFSSAQTLFASTTIVTPTQVWKYAITADGIRSVGNSPAFYFSPLDREIQFYKGIIYSVSGLAFDVNQVGYSGSFNTDQRETTALAIDAGNNRIYFLVSSQFQTQVLSFDLTTYQQIGGLTALNFGSGIGAFLSGYRMVACGKAGLAFAPVGKSLVTILPYSAIEPLPPYVKPVPIPLNDSARIFALPSKHITYDAGRHLIYASVPSSAGNIGNSIVPIDPFQGSVGNPIWIGSEPGIMGLSSDGTWLYTGLDASSSIRRLYLPYQIPEQSFRIRAEPDVLNPSGFTRAEGIIGLPHLTNSILVGLAELPGSTDVGSDGIVVYDNGVKRPFSIPGEHVGGVRTFQLAEDGETVYGIEPASNSHAFVNMRISQNGIQVISKTYNVVGARYLKCQNGLCFTENGAIIDAATQTLIGQFAFNYQDINFAPPTQLAPDVANGVVYFAGVSSYNRQIVVSAYNLNTRNLIRSYAIPSDRDDFVRDFFIWEGNQLAFNTDTRLVLLPTKLLAAP